MQVLQDNVSEAVDVALKMAPALTVNEMRRRLVAAGVTEAEGDVEGGDVILTTFNQVPLADIANPLPPMLPPPAPPEDPDAKLPAAAYFSKAINKQLGEAARKAAKGQHARSQLASARLFERELKGVLAKWQASQLAAIEDHEKSDPYGIGMRKVYTLADVETLIVDSAAEATEIARSRATTFHTRTVLQRAAEALAELGIVDVDIDVLSPAVQRYLAEKTQAFAGNWPATVTSRLRAQLTEGIRAGETINELQERVRTTMRVESSRALTVARTEATPAFNFGSEVAYAEAGVASREWLTAQDEHVRDTHARADGQVQPIGTPFNVGNESLDYPGDPGGTPGNIINCRCTTAAADFVEDE